MIYTSYAFLGFLLLAVFAYYIAPKRWQWKLLFIDSAVFYLAGGILNAVYIFITIIITWAGGLGIEKDHKKRKATLLICSFVNIIILLYIKIKLRYFAGEVLAPIGIAFYTLMSIGYLTDISRGNIKAEKNPFKIALFLSYFPHILTGPISRYDDTVSQLFAEHGFETENIIKGVQRILWGLFKKLVIADRLLPVVSEISGDLDSYKGAYVLCLMLFYAVQLYADFSGGIDIALGVSELFGIHLQENFIRPYFSKSLAEYWRRWHISMSSWFRDYMFYPLSMSTPIQSLSKKVRAKNPAIAKKLPVYISLIIVWLMTGLWHGVSVNFILWGFSNGLLLILANELGERISIENKYLAIAFTFFMTSALKLFDCYEGFEAIRAFASIFHTVNYHIIFDGSLFMTGMKPSDHAVLIVAVGMLFISDMAARTERISKRIEVLPIGVRAFLWCGLFIMILVFGVYGIGYEKTDFIYSSL